MQSQWLVAVQLGAGEDLPADGWNLQMRPGVPTHPPQGNFFVIVRIHLKRSSQPANEIVQTKLCVLYKDIKISEDHS